MTCDCMNMMTMGCMLSRRREKSQTKMAISSKYYVVHFLYLLASYNFICIIWYLVF